MLALVYVLCGATSFLCLVLLFRGYWRTRQRLLLWSSLCFLGLTLDNILLFMDLIVFPDINLIRVRELGALLGLTLLVFGLVWDTK